ncbi:hypothetical protein Taro_011024 [Colocasia esculenta]|uniref:Uncharacterized protein n=1 Tax=Colocasia esculenta TaxID=4460 RepID=A0A843U947_COLES|nr:hypothetical protein [Colocasia esculenta]
MGVLGICPDTVVLSRSCRLPGHPHSRGELPSG